MSDIKVLYRNLLFREGGIANALRDDPSLVPMINAVFAQSDRIGGSLEEKIKHHPDRPKTTEEELQLKQEIIQENIDYHLKQSGLCYSCEHYLPGRETITDAEIELQARIRHGLDPDANVCEKVGLSAKDAPLIICPHYQKSARYMQLYLDSSRGKDLALWEALQKKYGMPSEQRPTPEKKPRF